MYIPQAFYVTGTELMENWIGLMERCQFLVCFIDGILLQDCKRLDRIAELLPSTKAKHLAIALRVNDLAGFPAPDHGLRTPFGDSYYILLNYPAGAQIRIAGSVCGEPRSLLASPGCVLAAYMELRESCFAGRYCFVSVFAE